MENDIYKLQNVQHLVPQEIDHSQDPDEYAAYASVVPSTKSLNSCLCHSYNVLKEVYETAIDDNWEKQIEQYDENMNAFFGYERTIIDGAYSYPMLTTSVTP